MSSEAADPLSAPAPRWVLATPPDPRRVAGMVEALHLPRPLCALLHVRGHEDPEGAKGFLRPRLEDLHPPEHIPDLPLAVQRISVAIRNGETIFVHGDYDVDGMAGTALLVRWLEVLGGKVSSFVPHRVRDGYDLGPTGIQQALAADASLMVTVDCGILAHGAIEEAGREGLDVVVTDHHTPGESLPDALAVLNPARSESTYPNRELCGAGVAFKLCQGLAEAHGVEEEELHPFLDLVGLATVADLVPLRGENRTLARFGLKALSQTRNLGLRALMEKARVRPGEITAGKISFGLAPRLNALGRMGEPMDGLRLLCTQDREEARRLAARAEEVNRERQALDRRILEEAEEQLTQTFDPERDFGVVLDSDDWHPGVVGIVASRVVARIHRPAILVALEGDRGRGSARSIPEFHILQGIQKCSRFLERFGGHRQAAGMEILRHQVAAFREAFNQEAREVLEDIDIRPTLSVDVEVNLGEMSKELHKFLQYMGPHGMGNPGPSFLIRGATLVGSPRIVGGDHLKFRLKQGQGELDAIGFNLANRISPELLASGPLDVVFKFHENEFRGVRRLQAQVEDLRPAAGDDAWGEESENGEALP